VLLYAVVFTVGPADRTASDTATLRFGLRAGTFAGASGVVLLAVWMVDTQTSLSPVGWLTRATPMRLLGVLLGDAADRIRCGAEAQRVVQIARLRERQAADINDTIAGARDHAASSSPRTLPATTNEDHHLICQSVDRSSTLLPPRLERSLAQAARVAVDDTGFSADDRRIDLVDTTRQRRAGNGLS